MNRSRLWMLRAGLAFWLLAPLVALGVLTALAFTQTLDGPKAEVWVPVEASNSEVTTPVDIALNWSSNLELTAPAWSGLVQAVHVQPGSVIQDGSRIARIEGVDRIAVRADEPFYRPISAGDRGPDVEALNKYLARAGYSNSRTAIASGSTMEGVRKLGEALGVRGAQQFDPGWVVYLGTDTFTASGVELQVGAPAPGLGTAILIPTRSLGGATTVARGSLDSLLNPSTGPTADPVIEWDALEVDLQALQIPFDLELMVGSERVALDESRSAVTTDALLLLADVAEPGTLVIQANLSRMPNSSDVVIPTGAIFTGDSETTCVRRLRSERSQNVRLEVVADLNGRAIVRGDLVLGDRVRIGVPAQARTCG